MHCAPIILFAFNRPDTLKECVASLLKNDEAKESKLFVFVDGPRKGNLNDQEKVSSVQEYVKSITGFESLHYYFEEENHGLASSVIRGVSEVISQFGKVIVVEDDLLVSPNFLAFTNQGLELYKDKKKVFSICGFTVSIKHPKDYDYDAYFCTRSSSWGWATWKDRWETVDWNFEDWRSHKKHKRAFNKWGGSDCWKMLNDWHDGHISSWAIRFCYSQFHQQALSIFPIVSKVGNYGFDGRGTHGKKWSRFKYIQDVSTDKVFRFPDDIVVNKRLLKQVLSYHSVPIRIWSRIMYFFHR